MYFIKKNSADGRILIWKTALEMIKVHPIAGHGNNAIAAHYMDYQADYFEKHPDSPYILLGDNVKHLFNEYLEVGVRYGIVGWLLLLSTAWFMLHCYKKAQVYKQGIAFYSLGSISIFACFSYPLTYPFVWIILITDVILLVRGAYPQSFPHSYRKLGSSITGATILILSSVLLYKTATRIEAESQWGKISDISQRGNTEAMRPNFSKLMPILGKEPYFLYNYAAELYVSGYYKEALYIARQCRAYWADYDLELLLGEILRKLKQFQKAEQHFQKASLMCPVRFVPLYRIYELHKEQGDTATMQRLGKQILDKPIKIDSHTIRKIKQNIQKDLSFDI